MRRLRPSRATRSMARRTPAQRQPIPLQARAVVGWVAAIVILIGAAFAVGRIGGADVPSASPDASGGVAATPLPISFGTALDPGSGQVAADRAVVRFAAGDRFAYSVPHPDATGTSVLYVEVVRAEDVASAVQTPAPLPFNPPGASAFAYEVPADNLLADFGPGRYVMRIYVDPASEPIAEGEFELVEPTSSG